MGKKVPWKTGMLIYLPVTSRPLMFLQKEAVLSPCNFPTSHSTACILNFYLPFATHEMEDPFATPHLFLLLHQAIREEQRLLGECQMLL